MPSKRVIELVRCRRCAGQGYTRISLLNPASKECKRCRGTGWLPKKS